MRASRAPTNGLEELSNSSISIRQRRRQQQVAPLTIAGARGSRRAGRRPTVAGSSSRFFAPTALLGSHEQLAFQATCLRRHEIVVTVLFCLRPARRSKSGGGFPPEPPRRQHQRRQQQQQRRRPNVGRENVPSNDFPTDPGPSSGAASPATCSKIVDFVSCLVSPSSRRPRPAAWLSPPSSSSSVALSAGTELTNGCRLQCGQPAGCSAGRPADPASQPAADRLID